MHTDCIVQLILGHNTSGAVSGDWLAKQSLSFAARRRVCWLARADSKDGNGVSGSIQLLDGRAVSDRNTEVHKMDAVAFPFPNTRSPARKRVGESREVGKYLS
jgi:hypothetical protein